MSILHNIGLEIDEAFSGYVGIGETNPRKGVVIGKRYGTAISLDIRTAIDDVDSFINDPNHQGELRGIVTCQHLGGQFPIQKGSFNLFSLEAETGIRQVVYKVIFTAAGNRTYYLAGRKEIYDDPGKIDLVEDMTRLFFKIYRGDNDQAPPYGAGEMYFKLSDVPRLFTSMRVTGQASSWQQLAARTAYISFAYGALRDEYFKDLLPFYDTSYENLVLSGYVNSNGGTPRKFFLVSGVHGKDFPWGDDETFSDVVLAVGNGTDGYKRYCITDRDLKGLRLAVEQGTYQYKGPIFALSDGYSATLSDMSTQVEYLVKCEADFSIDFQATPYDTVPFPFPVWGRKLARLFAPIAKIRRKILPSLHPLGVRITPHTVTVKVGKFIITCPAANPREELDIVEDRTFGEAECSTFRNIREPKLSWLYTCAVQPESKVVRVQMQAGTLRSHRHIWVKDWLYSLMGIIISRFASAELLMKDNRLKVKRLSRRREAVCNCKLFNKTGDPVIEVNNDNFPTAIFQRRIIEVSDPEGGEFLALQEDMTLMRCKAINSGERVKIASIKNEKSGFKALDEVLEKTDFYELLEDKLKEKQKEKPNLSKSNFSIAIKPNFMLTSHKDSHSTYTDPKLVGHLVEQLRKKGFEKITLVEAQSTFGVFYNRHSVTEIAQYLGFDGAAGYDIVDMTEDALDNRKCKYFGQNLKCHLFSPVWADADFRISFAKNKTHAYAYYTLTLKNIYGALPEANKFKEYHCRRDIYNTAIEYLEEFPVDFGLVDAYLSADGPFGVFGDSRPNKTYTIIGGANLVAVDWVGAVKMGLDPMISPYMQLAVSRWGKPNIDIADGSDMNLYQPWLNVPRFLTIVGHKGWDRSHLVGNFLYKILANADEKQCQFRYRELHIWLLRKLTKPIRYMLFITGEKPTLANRILSWFVYKLG